MNITIDMMWGYYQRHGGTANYNEFSHAVMVAKALNLWDYDKLGELLKNE